MWRLTIYLLALVVHCDSARILCIIPTPSYSHQITYQPIFKELAKRGHEITLMTTDLMKYPPPTLKQVDLSQSYDIWKRDLGKLISSNLNPFVFFLKIFDAIDEVTNHQLGHPEVQALIKNETEHFDLLMTDLFSSSTVAFKERFKCPTILLASFAAQSSVQQIFGNAVNYVLYPDSIVPYDGEMNFFQRLSSFAISNGLDQYARFFVYPKRNKDIIKYFGEGYPDVGEMLYSADMLFTNTNPVININRPLTPSTIQIGGGIHILPPKALPKDLKQYLDEAKDGFIYLSLGSNIKSKDLSVQTKVKFMQAFSDLPYKVLWKFEADDLPGKPNNVRIMKWLPQQDVLRHPNIKVFITQGGLQSFEEGLFSHVPLLCVPFMGDQKANAVRISNKGIGLRLDHATMTVDELKASLLEIIKNPIYKNKIKELAILSSDQPMTAMQKAVWWTEYVIRHKGAQHLKGPGINFPLYQYYYLDIIGFVGLILVIFIFSMYFICKIVTLLSCKLFSRKKIKAE